MRIAPGWGLLPPTRKVKTESEGLPPNNRLHLITSFFRPTRRRTIRLSHKSANAASTPPRRGHSVIPNTRHRVYDRFLVSEPTGKRGVLPAWAFATGAPAFCFGGFAPGTPLGMGSCLWRGFCWPESCLGFSWRARAGGSPQPRQHHCQRIVVHPPGTACCKTTLHRVLRSGSTAALRPMNPPRTRMAGLGKEHDDRVRPLLPLFSATNGLVCATNGLAAHRHPRMVDAKPRSRSVHDGKTWPHGRAPGHRMSNAA